MNRRDAETQRGSRLWTTLNFALPPSFGIVLGAIVPQWFPSTVAGYVIAVAVIAALAMVMFMQATLGDWASLRIDNVRSKQAWAKKAHWISLARGSEQADPWRSLLLQLMLAPVFGIVVLGAAYLARS